MTTIQLFNWEKVRDAKWFELHIFSRLYLNMGFPLPLVNFKFEPKASYQMVIKH